MRRRAPDPRDADPEVRKERIKLLSAAANAFGLALFIGALVGPFVDPNRSIELWRTLSAITSGVGCVLFAFWVLRYMKSRG